MEHCYSIIIIPDRITFTPTRELRLGVNETFTAPMSRLYSHDRVKETFTPSRKLRVGMGLTLTHAIIKFNVGQHAGLQTS